MVDGMFLSYFFGVEWNGPCFMTLKSTCRGVKNAISGAFEAITH